MRWLSGAIRGRGRRLPGWLQPLLLVPPAVVLHGMTPSGEVDLSSLRPGQHVEIAYHTKGCFHDERARIFLGPDGDGGLRYATLMWGGAAWGALDRGEAEGLARRVELMREGEMACTSSERVTITLYDHGIPVRRERGHDANCSMGEKGDPLPFYRLLPEP